MEIQGQIEDFIVDVSDIYCSKMSTEEAVQQVLAWLADAWDDGYLFGGGLETNPYRA